MGSVKSYRGPSDRYLAAAGGPKRSSLASIAPHYPPLPPPPQRGQHSLGDGSCSPKHWFEGKDGPNSATWGTVSELAPKGSGRGLERPNLYTTSQAPLIYEAMCWAPRGSEGLPGVPRPLCPHVTPWGIAGHAPRGSPVLCVHRASKFFLICCKTQESPQGLFKDGLNWSAIGSLLMNHV